LNAGTRQFLRFGLVGVLGLGVDTAALYFAKDVLGLGLYGGRVFSYLVAATFTWAANRRYTFTQADTSHPIHQWGKFLAANAVGGLVNYGVYAALVTLWPLAAAYPVIGIAAGSLSGMTFNFIASKRWVFKA
jgi:putative flippase GtrA